MEEMMSSTLNWTLIQNLLCTELPNRINSLFNFNNYLAKSSCAPQFSNKSELMNK